jgi:hypothetical protein
MEFNHSEEKNRILEESAYKLFGQIVGVFNLYSPPEHDKCILSKFPMTFVYTIVLLDLAIRNSAESHFLFS